MEHNQKYFLFSLYLIIAGPWLGEWKYGLFVSLVASIPGVRWQPGLAINPGIQRRSTQEHDHQLAVRTNESESSNREHLTTAKKSTRHDDTTTAGSLGTRITSPDRPRQRQHRHFFSRRGTAFYILYTRKKVKCFDFLFFLFTYFRHMLTAELAADRCKYDYDV